jgi:hypothetical protein
VGYSTDIGVKLEITLYLSREVHMAPNTLSSPLTGEDSTEFKMADPFEVRMRFTSQLQSMNASVNSAQKAAHFALRYRDMQEDLHSCILEQLEQVSLQGTYSRV